MHQPKMFCVAFILVFVTSLTAGMEVGKPGRRFGSQIQMRRVDVEPREVATLSLMSNKNPKTSCAAECYRRQWCHAFNVLYINKQCEMFDSEISAGLVSDSDCSYEQKISIDLRSCDELVVINGFDIPSGRKHNGTANVTCNDGFASIHNNVSCNDGVFKAHTAVGNSSVISVRCYKVCGELPVANGTSISAGTKNGTMVEIVCDTGLRSYYTSAECVDGTFVPSRVLCEDYPSPVDDNAVKYQGQWLKVFNNPSRRWDSAVNVCISHGGLPATVLSKHLLLKIRHMIPVGKYWNPQVVVGLQQKWYQPTPNVGWQWVDRSNENVIDIDAGNTVKLQWCGPAPSNGDNENYGTIYKSFCCCYGFNDGPIAHSSYTSVLCQIGYPYYEFKPAYLGVRMVFPHESTVVGVSYDNCTESCIQSAFCRTFSYSITLSDCRHHSIPPDDPEAVTVSDEKYNIYA